VFISPRNRVARLYPQAVGSHFFASNDSQVYGGGIGPRLHTGHAYIERNSLNTRIYRGKEFIEQNLQRKLIHILDSINVSRKCYSSQDTKKKKNYYVMRIF
jgi:hypothetical protein